MNKNIISIGLVFFLLMIGGQQCAEKVSIGTAFVGGTQGLSLSFVEGAPPIEVFDQGKTSFSVNVLIENKGEWDVNKDDAEITISGINPAVFGSPILNKKLNAKLEGVEKDVQGNIVPGTITYLDFSGFKFTDSIAGSVILPIKADACYNYGTNVNSKLCILRDLLSRVPGTANSMCTVNEAKSVENSGAPVQITELKERAVENNRIMFSFIVQHLGTGAVSELNSNCNSSIAKKDKIKIKVDTGIGSPGDLICNFDSGTGTEGTVTLYGGNRLVSCTQTISSPTDYEQLINIEMLYDYRDSITTSLKVSHLS